MININKFTKKFTFYLNYALSSISIAYLLQDLQ